MPTLHTATSVARRIVKRPWRAHGLVLMYHRVAAASWDPWDICVNPERFEQHLEMLARVVDFVPLSELTPRLRRGRRARPVVAVTFDDGYADNLYAALPVLERYGVPATIFLATAWIGRDEPFWWDRLSAIVQAIDPLASEVRLPIAGEEFIWRRRADDDDHASDRNRLHVALWSSLIMASASERDVALNQAELLANPAHNGADSVGRPLTRDELGRLASSPLIEIGAHTMTHCRLSDLPPHAQFDEILGSRQQCRELIGEFPSSFAYPFGAHDNVTPDLVQSAGFDRACSSESDLVWADSNPMLVPRIQVRNHTARELSMVLRMKWLL